MKSQCKNYSPEEKVVILKRHLIDKIAVLDLCDEYTIFNRRFSIAGRRSFSRMGQSAFERETLSQTTKETDRIRAILTVFSADP